ncbi:hypothetical protein ACGFZP_23975 [Kitasatospora sp. NPDC048239]|uniref:hypothetical protein n=1 Tax=Kitasatospora sp. NPDC048239 TaxID=3364046 RepID=UPI003711C68C
MSKVFASLGISLAGVDLRPHVLGRVRSGEDLRTDAQGRIDGKGLAGRWRQVRMPGERSLNVAVRICGEPLEGVRVENGVNDRARPSHRVRQQRRQ